jgi:Tol biopolymer transport system component
MIGLALGAIIGVGMAAQGAVHTERVSVASNGLESDGYSYSPTISRHGRFVVFDSDASNLVRHDRHGGDVFIHDRRRHTTKRVSFAWPGRPAESDCEAASISGDGRRVAFSCLGPEDPNSGSRSYAVYVRDMRTRTVTALSVSPSGRPQNYESEDPSISRNGRYVAFASDSSNLVTGDRNHRWDIFVRDVKARQTTRVSVSSTGAAANAHSTSPSISANGRFVAYVSRASNLVAGDNRSTTDVFVHDRASATTTRVSTAIGGGNAHGDSSVPAISAGGRYVAFQSLAPDLTSPDPRPDSLIFIHDRQTGLTRQIPAPSAPRRYLNYEVGPAMSGDGRYIAFAFTPETDVGQAQALLYDTVTDATRTLSVNSRGEAVAGGQPALSGDGRFATFVGGDNVVPNDLNGAPDIFVTGPLG